MSFDEWIVDRACVAVLGRYRVRRSEVYESRFVHLFWMEDGSVVKVRAGVRSEDRAPRPLTRRHAGGQAPKRAG
jgi:hypothetical protein